MAFRTNLPNFSKGELAPELIARTDVASYSAGVRRGRNVFIRKYGGLSKRMGTRFVSEVLDASQPVRLLPFQFSIEQAYALEFGQGYMRPAANGGMLLEEALAITGIDRGLTTVIHAAFHGYAVGDLVYFRDVAGMPEINGRTAKVVAVGGPGAFTVDVDSRAFSPFTGDAGGITRAGDPTPPPPPPPVPNPTPTPTPPSTGGGGGVEGRCVAALTTIVLLANADRDGPGEEVRAGDVVAGMYVWTQPEGGGPRGAYRVLAAEVAPEDTYRADGFPDATAGHRFSPDADGSWALMRDLGVPTGRSEPVWKATVEEAKTYLARRITSDRWVLSHNIKQYEQAER